MAYIQDREVRFCEIFNDKNEYSWTLQEFDENGNALGDPQKPWLGVAQFVVSDIRMDKSITLEESKSKTKEIISCKLIPNRYPNDYSYYIFSMFGTDRKINNFRLGIFKIEEENDNPIETCKIWGEIAETDVDYVSYKEDGLHVEVHMTVNRFDEVAKIILNENPDCIRVTLSGISGCYIKKQNWLEIYGKNDVIKILTKYDEHGIIFPDSCNINPPELGVVEYFSFWAYKDYNADIETEAKEDDLKSIEIDSEININALLIENLKQNEVALNQISMDIKEKEFSINQLKLDSQLTNLCEINTSILEQIKINEIAIEKISLNIENKKLSIENSEILPELKSYIIQNDNLLIKIYKILWLIFIVLISIFIKYLL